MNKLSSAIGQLVNRQPFGKSGKVLSCREYWERRVQQHGRLSVLNLGHQPDDFEAVTERQKREIFPHFRRMLAGGERLVLDYGCGPGRFSADLAAQIEGRCLGVDIVESLLEMAPDGPSVEYRVIRDGAVPAPDGSCDVVWVCLVLGGLAGPELARAAWEIERVLKPGGLLFLVENTSEKPDGDHWHFRGVKEYRRLFPCATLEHLHDYDDLGERISILAGRKSPVTPRDEEAGAEAPPARHVAPAGGPRRRGLTTWRKIFFLAADTLEYRYLRLKGAVFGISSIVSYLRNPNPRLTAKLLRAFGATVGERTTFKRTLFLDNVWEDQHSAGDFSYISIGSNCYVGDCVFFDLSDRVVLEDDVVVAGRVSFISHADCNRSKALETRFPRKCEPVVVRKGAWIGFGSTVLSGVEIGSQSVIAANSLVRENTCADSIYTGNPAKKLRDIVYAEEPAP